jgi:hypothetical protein
MSLKRLSVGAVALAMFRAAAQAQQTRYPKPTELPIRIASWRAGLLFPRI